MFAEVRKLRRAQGRWMTNAAGRRCCGWRPTELPPGPGCPGAVPQLSAAPAQVSRGRSVLSTKLSTAVCTDRDGRRNVDGGSDTLGSFVVTGITCGQWAEPAA